MSNFPAARLKIDRAYTHIAEMQALCDWYCAPQLHTMTVQENAPGSEIGLQSEPLPPQAALIFGDAVHSLRSALDHAAFALTAGKSRKNSISFPFGKSLVSLKATVKGGDIKVASPAVLDAILKEIRPYLIDEDTGEPGNAPLWMLNKLDNIDKHREVLLTTSVVQTHIKRLDFDANIVFQDNVFISDGGHQGAIMGLPGMPVQGQYTTTVDIIINEPDFFHGEPVVPTLHQLAQLTTSALDILEPLF